MRLVTDRSALKGISFENTVATIGVFDGVHLGHQEVIRRLTEIKETEGRDTSILLTFDRHPLSVTHPEMVPPLLTTLEEKISILARLNVDTIIVEPFSEETARLDYRAFISTRLIDELDLRHLVMGYDFHLGADREGSQERIVEEGTRSGFNVTIVPPVVLGGRAISSTRIRKAITERKLDQAARYLGRVYFFDAEVTSGEKVGRKLDFPTANLTVSEGGKLLPPSGVYAVDTEVEGSTYGGMMNIGTAPTIHGDGRHRIEVHLFDFSGDLYGKRIRVSCRAFVRCEKKFKSSQELQLQLVRDREKVLRILEKKS